VTGVFDDFNGKKIMIDNIEQVIARFTTTTSVSRLPQQDPVPPLQVRGKVRKSVTSAISRAKTLLQ